MTATETAASPPRRPITRREEIIDAARDICARDGFEALTMRRLAAAIDVTAPALYRHFADKESIERALVDRANGVFGSYVRRGLEADDPAGRLRRSLDSILDFAIERPHEYEALFFRPGLTPDRLPLEGRSPNFIFLVDRIRECTQTKALRRGLDPVLTAITVWAQAHGLVALHRQGRFEGDDRTFRDVAERSLSILLEGLGAPPATTE